MVCAFATLCPKQKDIYTVNSFSELNLSAPLLKAIAAEGYDKPTPIQARAIPELLKGRDLLGIAQTGTGKTAAFALPILERLSHSTERVAKNSCKVLVLSPTRELASQIGESFKTYGRNVKVTRAVVFGGVSIGKQIDILRGGVDVVVATPGRLVDLIELDPVDLGPFDKRRLASIFDLHLARALCLGTRFQRGSQYRRHLPDAAGRNLCRQWRGASARRGAHDGVSRDEMAQWLVGGRDLRRRILRRHPFLCRQGRGSLRLVNVNGRETARKRPAAGMIHAAGRQSGSGL